MNRTIRLCTALVAVTLCMQATVPAVSETEYVIPEMTPQPEIVTTAESTITPSPSQLPEITISPEATAVLPPLDTPSPASTEEPGEIPVTTPEATVEPSIAPSFSATPEAEITPAPEITPEPTVSVTPESSVEPEATPVPSLNPDETNEAVEETPAPEEAEVEKKRKKVRRDNSIGWRGVVQSDERGMAIPMLFQNDYKKVVYYHHGTPKSVSTSGCGATSVSMVIAYLTGNTEQNPYTLFYDAVENGFYRGNGLSQDVLSLMAAEYGVKSRWISNDADAIINALNEGKPVIAHMGKGIFTETGHYVVLRGVTEDGKILLNDPDSRANCSKAFPIENLLREARNSRSFMVCWAEASPTATPGN